MLLTWVIRLVILAIGFAIHWALGAVLVFSLYCHMKIKARAFEQRYSYGLIKAPWYRF